MPENNRPIPDPVAQKLDQINEQIRQLNQLVAEATPDLPQSILKEDHQND